MRQLGGYTLTDRLGIGGMGEVWKGRREALGGAAVDVAIKVLSPGKVHDEEARRMFLDEARLSMLLTASNIVKVFDAAEAEDGTCYMVMEWVDGLNLAQLNKQAARAREWHSDRLVAYIVGEVLKGLAHAHDLRHGDEHITIVHRDISAHNVMCSVNGEVKVMDFGIARMASEDTSGVHVKGKLRYMPPEQLRGETRKPTLDLFAVGAILHELLDGVPFRSRVLDEGHLYGMIIAGDVPPMKRDPATIPVELEQLRQALLAPDPDARVQSAREAFQWLSNWSGYRDARFELDEIVRRHAQTRAAAAPSPAPPSEPSTAILTHSASPPMQSGREAAFASASFASLSASPSSSVSASSVDATAVVRPEGSNTLLDIPASSTAAPHEPKTIERKTIAFGFALLGVALLGFGAAAAVFRGDRDTAPEVAASVDPPGTSPLAPPEPSPAGAQEQPTGAQAPAAPVEAAPTTVDPAPTTAEPDPTPEDPAPPPEASAAPVKVSLSLASGVKWAEIKLGGRRVVLDAFDKKASSTRLPPGEHALSSRAQFDGSWRKGPRLKIEPGVPVSIRVHKNGTLTLR